MRTYGVAFLGFGNVARALATLLEARRAELAVRYGVAYRVVGVASRSLGWWADPAGLALTAPRTATKCYDVTDWLLTARADVVFETLPLDPVHGQPALDFTTEALRAGANVVSANKGPVVHGFGRLTALATAQGRSYRFESAVMDGAPVFSLVRRSLPLAHITRVRGVFTSTATVVLEAVERGGTIDDGIRHAQTLGIAEADPSYDVNGWDSAVKLSAIAQAILERALDPAAVVRRGLRELDPTDVRAAAGEGQPFRLIGDVAVDGDAVTGRVEPVRVPRGDPLAVSGTTLVTHFETPIFPGGLTITSGAPDLTTTAYGLFADFLEAIAAT